MKSEGEEGTFQHQKGLLDLPNETIVHIASYLLKDKDGPDPTARGRGERSRDVRALRHVCRRTRGVVHLSGFSLRLYKTSMVREACNVGLIALRSGLCKLSIDVCADNESATWFDKLMELLPSCYNLRDVQIQDTRIDPSLLDAEMALPPTGTEGEAANIRLDKLSLTIGHICRRSVSLRRYLKGCTRIESLYVRDLHSSSTQDQQSSIWPGCFSHIKHIKQLHIDSVRTWPNGSPLIPRLLSIAKLFPSIRKLTCSRADATSLDGIELEGGVPALVWSTIAASRPIDELISALRGFSALDSIDVELQIRELEYSQHQAEAEVARLLMQAHPTLKEMVLFSVEYHWWISNDGFIKEKYRAIIWSKDDCGDFGRHVYSRETGRFILAC